jgi:hypothetical protein
MSWAAIGAAVAGAVISAGASYGISQSQKMKQPNLASSSEQLSNTNAAILPIRRLLESAAAQGLKITVPGQFEYQVQDRKGKWSTISEENFNRINKYNGLSQPVAFKPTAVRKIPRVVDFTGLGTADVQSKIADELARSQLELDKKYGGQMIDVALEQEKLADPQGFAARDKENELIQKQIADKPQRPVAELLDKQIGDEVQAAKSGKLDPEMHGVLDDAVGKALNARGGGGDGNNGAPADFEQPLTTGFAGEARQSAAAQKAMSLLSSGSTTEDVDYRREIAVLSNLSALVNGRTPQSQFSSLSAAQNGPVKMQSGSPLATMPNNAFGAQGPANSNWMTGMSQALNQVNPATFALSVVTGAGKVASNAGWQPFANNN